MDSFMKFYRDVIIKGVIMIGVVVLFGLALLYPLYSDLMAVDEDIQSTKTEIEKQSVFVPKYTVMQQRSAVGAEVHLEVPEKLPIAVPDLGKAAKNVGLLAEQAGLNVVDVVISPSSLKEGNGKLMMQAMTIGDIPSFRDFYTKLGAWGAVERVSMVMVNAVSGGLEFYLEFWVHIEGEAG